MSLFSQLTKALLGFDVFVSYSRVDAGAYASELVDLLERRGYGCFLDKEELPPGQDLPSSLTRALRRSRALVLIGTERALGRHYVDREVRAFLDAGKPVIPVNVGHVLERGPWTGLRNAAWIDESPDAVSQGHPSAAVVDEIRKWYRLARRQLLALLTVSVAGIALIGFGLWAVIERRAGHEQELAAAREARVARVLAIADAAMERLDNDPELALQLAIEAARDAPDLDPQRDAGIDDALRAALRASRLRRELAPEGSAPGTVALSISPAGIMTVDRQGAIRRWPLEGTKPGAMQTVLLRDPSPMMAFDRAGTRYITVDAWSHAKVGRWEPAVVHLTPRDATNVKAVAISANGSRAASVDGRGVVMVWGADRGDVLATIDVEFTDKRESVSALALSADGGHIAVGDSSGRIRIFEISRGQPVADIDSPAPSDRVGVLDFDPSGRRLAAAYRDASVRVHDLDDSSNVRLLVGHHEDVSFIAFSDDGERLLTGSRDGTVIGWTFAKSPLGWPVEATWTVDHRSAVAGVAFLPGSQNAASVGYDGSLRIWYAGAAEEVAHLPGSGTSGLAFSADGQRLATASGRSGAAVWEVQTWTLVKQVPGPKGSNWPPVAMSPDGSWVAIGGGNGPLVGSVDSAQQAIELPDHGSTVSGLAFGSEGRWLATIAYGGRVQLWDMQTGVLDRELQAEGGRYGGRMSLSHDSSLLAAAPQEVPLRIWRTSDWSQFPVPTGLDSSLAFAVSATPAPGRLFDKGRANRPALWDLGTGERLREFQGLGNQVNAVAFSPDGRLVAATDRNEVLKIWHADTGAERASLRGYGDLAFSPDGELLAAVQRDGSVQVYAVTRRALMRIATEQRLLRRLSADECLQYLGRPCN